MAKAEAVRAVCSNKQAVLPLQQQACCSRHRPEAGLCQGSAQCSIKVLPEMACNTKRRLRARAARCEQP